MGNTLRAQEMQHQQYRFVLCVIGLIAVVTASGGHKGKAKGKMPHATACQGKSVADRCSFTGKEGTAIQGICMKMQGQLVCGTVWKPLQTTTSRHALLSSQSPSHKGSNPTMCAA